MNVAALSKILNFVACGPLDAVFKYTAVKYGVPALKPSGLNGDPHARPLIAKPATEAHGNPVARGGHPEVFTLGYLPAPLYSADF